MNYYFDNNATTQLSVDVSRAITKSALYDYGNPSSIYSFGIRSKDLLEKSRENVANFFSSKPSQIIFTSGATESNNTIIHSALLQNPNRRTILYSAVEHSSVYFTLLHYQKLGYILQKIPVSEAGIDEKFITNQLSSDVALVTIMTVNNETGQIFPVNRIFDKVKQYDPQIICHSDSVQAVGKTSISTHCIDYMSISAHKFHGPKGVGCIYKSLNMELYPLVFGGTQEKGLRPGTENISGIVGMGVAISNVSESNYDTINRLYNLTNIVEASLSEYDSYIVCKESARVPGVINIGFSGIEANTLLLKLNQYNIYVSTGSACNSNNIGVSRIISEMQIPEEYCSTIRISMSKFTTFDEVSYLIKKMKFILSKYK